MATFTTDEMEQINDWLTELSDRSPLPFFTNDELQAIADSLQQPPEEDVMPPVAILPLPPPLTPSSPTPSMATTIPHDNFVVYHDRFIPGDRAPPLTIEEQVWPTEARMNVLMEMR